MRSCYVFIFIISNYVFLNGQSESTLKYALEGQRVEVLIEMPATSEGIDINADSGRKMDYEDYSRRIKKYGIALFPGDVVMITKIKKKGKHIEFQLAGGGYGTFGDDNDSVSAIHISKSARQEELENMLQEDKEKNLQNRNKLEKELKDLQRERTIRQKESNRQAAMESEIKKSRIQEQRLQGGSRFNVRYDYKIGKAELTQESLENALREYVNFTPGISSEVSTYPENAESQNSNLRKGMMMEEVFSVNGIPKNLTTSKECGLELTTCTFDNNNLRIEAIFAEKVLVKYTVSSK